LNAEKCIFAECFLRRFGHRAGHLSTVKLERGTIHIEETIRRLITILVLIFSGNWIRLFLFFISYV